MAVCISCALAHLLLILPRMACLQPRSPCLWYDSSTFLCTGCHLLDIFGGRSFFIHAWMPVVSALKEEHYLHKTTTYKWRNKKAMHGKSWKTWTAALKVIFTTNRVTLLTPLGNWKPNVVKAQKLTTYRDTKTNTLYRSSHNHTRTWTAHDPVSAQGRTITFNNTPGEPCTPPKQGVKISLQT